MNQHVKSQFDSSEDPGKVISEKNIDSIYQECMSKWNIEQYGPERFNVVSVVCEFL